MAMMPTSTNTNRSLFIAFIAFLIVSGWYGSSAIADIASFNDWDKPKLISQLWRAGVFGLVGALFAAGVDVKQLLGPLGSFLPGTTSTITETTAHTTEVKVTEDPKP
jgi:hypothetical protein